MLVGEFDAAVLMLFVDIGGPAVGETEPKVLDSFDRYLGDSAARRDRVACAER